MKKHPHTASCRQCEHRKGGKRDWDDYREQESQRKQQRRRVINRHQRRELKERTEDA